jgi:hypothetical protein
MKRFSALLPALLFAMAPFTVLAQDHTIDGKAVPEGQMTAIQDRCRELQAQQGTTGTQVPETTMPESDEDQAAQASSEGGDNATFDIGTVTLEQCVAGGFTEQNNE